MGFTIGCPGCRAISRGEKESQNHTEECREIIEKALIGEGGVKGKRMTEGNQRYEEHKTKNNRRGETRDGKEEEQHDQKGTKRGADDTGTAASSSGNQRENQAEEEHVRKYQRQDDEDCNPEEEQPDIGMDSQPDKGESDCMFVEEWRERQPDLHQVQGGASKYWDDLSGKPLKEELVNKARKEEMG